MKKIILVKNICLEEQTKQWIDINIDKYMVSPINNTAQYYLKEIIECLKSGSISNDDVDMLNDLYESGYNLIEL